uniref:Reverse transcriptase zinc-binding domain-containing protein n=1 Tax=Hordeum vulgare subsp. vulgare TaxID=112509 RepID=A0A8I6Y2N0_HORVV
MYRWLERNLAGAHYKWIWGAKIPLKIQIFLWQFFQNSILTRDNMRKIQWQGDPKCSFCNELESAQHLFFGCSVARIVWRTVGVVFGTSYIPKTIWQVFSWLYVFLPGLCEIYTVGLAAVCWSIWLARNRATFEKKWIKTPFEIAFTTSAFIDYWAGMQKPAMAENVKKGAQLLKKSAAQMLRLCEPPRAEASEQAEDEEIWDEW